MKVTGLENKEIEVIMTSDERYIITSCLAYLCHAQTPPAFAVIATAEMHEVEKVLDSLLSVYHVPPQSYSEEELQHRNAVIARSHARYLARRRAKVADDTEE